MRAKPFLATLGLAALALPAIAQQTPNPTVYPQQSPTPAPVQSAPATASPALPAGRAPTLGGTDEISVEDLGALNLPPPPPPVEGGERG